MSIMTIDLGGDNYLTTGPVCTGIHFGDGSESHFDLDMLGEISEWLAVAWDNLAGEEYKPVILSERGYVAQESELAFDRVNLERDCE